MKPESKRSPRQSSRLLSYLKITPPIADLNRKRKNDMHDIAGDSRRVNTNSVNGSKKFTLTVKIEPDGRTVQLQGRAAWMMRELIKAGKCGVTTIDLPAGVRVSHAVYLLRREGFIISMQREAHGGEFAGVHGRFKIETPCVIVEDAAELAA
jgi:hypothetical protein